jgi:hypothetical protein
LRYASFRVFSNALLFEHAFSIVGLKALIVGGYAILFLISWRLCTIRQLSECQRLYEGCSFKAQGSTNP